MIGIIMLNYNEWHLSRSCIDSIRKNIKSDYRIYLVDNASPSACDSVFLQFVENSDDVEFIQLEKNLGYAAGNNQGLKKAIQDGCDNFLITNNDVVFKPDTIDKLRNYLKNNKNVGIVGPKVYTGSGQIQEINMGCKMTLGGKYLYLLRKTPLKFVSRKFVSEFHCENQSLNRPFKVYAVSGCCFMISGSVIDNLFPLDEGTFLYEEENIIGHKMELLGYDTMYCADAEVVHLGGESTKGVSEFSYICGVNSEIYYCRKYLNGKFLQVFPLYLVRTFVYIRKYGIKGINKFFKSTFLCFRNKI